MKKTADMLTREREREREIMIQTERQKERVYGWLVAIKLFRLTWLNFLMIFLLLTNLCFNREVFYF